MLNSQIFSVVKVGGEAITGGLQPFMFMKPLQEAINHNLPFGETISSVTSTLLFFVDIFIILGIVATIAVGIYGACRIQFSKMKARDETANVKEIEANLKKEKKNVITGTIVLGIIFLLIPAIVSIISAIISSS